MDALSEILRSVNVDGAVFVDAQFTAPWRMESPTATALRDALSPGAGHLLLYHFVVEGECFATLDSMPPQVLKAGDAIVIPCGDAHSIASSAHAGQGDAIDMLELLRRPARRADFGGSGPEARLICGYMACDPWLSRTIFDALPRAITINVRRDTQSDWLERAMRDAVREASSSLPGGRGVLAKLAELVLVEMLRRHIQAADGQPGWLRGLRDPIVGRSLAALHRRPAYPWTVDTLARNVGASRSVLAERFRRLVGQPPMQYLTRWRMALAANYLRRTSLSLIRIAEEVGYDTGTAFNRAFVREFGEPPARWRRQAVRTASHSDDDQEIESFA